MMQLITNGGPVMWPLLVCSLLSLTVTIERVIYHLRFSRRLNSDSEQMINHVESGRFDQATSLGEQSRDPIAKILAAGLKHKVHGLTEAMQIAGQQQIRDLRRSLGVLDTIVTLAPLLGILGTVLGIIDSFDILGSAGVEDPRAVVGGIAEALVTTAAGLVIAVLSLIPYNWLVSRVRAYTERVEAVTTQFEIAARQGMGVIDEAQ